jgi:hypothetical protein
VLWRNIKKVVQLSYVKKKKNSWQGVGKFAIDEMLKGAFNKTRSIKKKKKYQE